MRPPRSAMSSPFVSLPLILMSSTIVYCEYWSTMHCARSSNALASSLVHQSFRLPLRVELAPLVVEAVGELVADGAAGVAVVGRVVHLRVVERRLQHAGGKVDVVHLRVVVRVDRGRRHAPFAAVEGLADLGEVALRLEALRALDVAEEVAALHHHRRVVAPLVGIADLVDDGRELLLRALLRRLAHPVERLEVTAHRLLDPARHVQRARLELRAECAPHELRPSASPSWLSTNATQRFQRGRSSGTPRSVLLKKAKFSFTKAVERAPAPRRAPGASAGTS